MATKKIGIVLPDLRGGGAERVGLTLMHSFREAGHEVDMVLMEERGELLGEVLRDVTIVNLRASRVRNAVAPLVRYFRERRPDAVQVSMWPLTVAAIIARRISGWKGRLVLSDHAALSKHYAGQPLTLRLLRSTVRLFYPMADARVVVARGAADDLARISGLPRSAFEVVYNPVDAPARQPVSTPEAERLWKTSDPRIITVGSLKDQKNHELLIRSFARLRAKRPAKLMILGTGPLESQLRARAAALGVSNDVIFVGFTPNPWSFYASADLFVLSSNYEGYPLVLIEAMRCGLPIVSTDCESGPREILDGGRFGGLVPVGDEAALASAMQQALDTAHDPDLLRGRAEELSGAGTARRYLELLLGHADA